MPFQRSEKQKKIRIKNSIEIESRIRLPCVRARRWYVKYLLLEQDVNSVNPIGLYQATFATIGRCALLNCHRRPRFRERPVIRGQMWGGKGEEVALAGENSQFGNWLVGSFRGSFGVDFQWIERWKFILSVQVWC